MKIFQQLIYFNYNSFLSFFILEEILITHNEFNGDINFNKEFRRFYDYPFIIFQYYKVTMLRKFKLHIISCNNTIYVRYPY